MTKLVSQAAWMLVIAFALSLLYEFWRATVKQGTSRHDSMQSFVKNNVAFYAIAATVIGLLFAGFSWATWVALAFSVGAIAASILYYNPRVMVERSPGLIDWFEDLVFTGLLFVAAALLMYSSLDITLQP